MTKRREVKKMKIQVTSEHIQNGKRTSAFNCPIALAMKDTGLANVSVGPKHAVVVNTAGDKIISLPIEVRSFIKTFDDNLPVEPFEFEINLKEK